MKRPIEDKIYSLKNLILEIKNNIRVNVVSPGLVKDSEEKYEKRFIELGTSDGVNVQVLKGLKMEDEIKIWNKTTKEDKKEEQ